MITTTTTTIKLQKFDTIIDRYKKECQERFLQAQVIDGKLVIDLKSVHGHYTRRTFHDEAGTFTTSRHYRYWNEDAKEPFEPIFI
jgi:hypothetical protein